jgi:hypothetical protein
MNNTDFFNRLPISDKEKERLYKKIMADELDPPHDIEDLPAPPKLKRSDTKKKKGKKPKTPA